MTPFCIIDFEATCWEKKSSQRNEIIEFAAILVDETYSHIKQFTHFVKPKLNPILSDFCKNLTTIQQLQVDEAFSFDIVLELFNKWKEKHTDSIFCSWGFYDKNQLIKDCTLWNAQYPFDDRHINIKEAFAKKLQIKPCGVAKALKLLNMDFEGIHHRGIDDVKNIIRICKQSNLNLLEN